MVNPPTTPSHGCSRCAARAMRRSRTSEVGGSNARADPLDLRDGGLTRSATSRPSYVSGATIAVTGGKPSSKDVHIAERRRVRAALDS
jgi:hypothetical protein